MEILEQAAAARQALENDLPDLEELAAKYDLDAYVQSASETAVSLNFPLGTARLSGLLDELGFGAGIMSRIGNTRALDGTLRADAPHATASWTYHPDDGLSIVIERID